MACTHKRKEKKPSTTTLRVGELRLEVEEKKKNTKIRA